MLGPSQSSPLAERDVLSRPRHGRNRQDRVREARSCSIDRRCVSSMRATGCGVYRVTVRSDRFEAGGFLQLTICGDCLRDNALHIRELYKAR